MSGHERPIVAITRDDDIERAVTDAIGHRLAFAHA